MRLVLLSDTHGFHELAVPDGDVLLHAGDFSRNGGLRDVERFERFLGRLPHRHKILIAGNHDFVFQKQRGLAQKRLKSARYLQDSGCEVEGLRIYGSPWQPEFFDWAFNLPRGEPLRRVWARIPDEVDVLITHGPPAGLLDRNSAGEAVGCADLRERVRAVRPGLHLFGHIHEAAGVAEVDGTLFVNASVCDLRYRPVNPAVVVDWEASTRRFRVVPPVDQGTSVDKDSDPAG